MVWWWLALGLCAAVVGGAWWWRIQNQHAQRRLAWKEAMRGGTLPVAAQRAAARSAARHAPQAPTQAEQDTGPATVLSYLHMDTSEGRADQLPSLPDLPLPLANTPDGQRVQRAITLLHSGGAAQAWQGLKTWVPPSEVRTPCMQTLEHLAMVFERGRLQTQAREVYEHMADIDPAWRNVKLRLMRARGLAQNAKANQWGTVPPQPEHLGQAKQLGKYLIEQQIGRGAMGAVYAGYDPATGRRLALKTMALAKEFSGADLIDARSRFLREAEMAGRLDHPDIVRVIDAGEIQGLAFIAMELIEGHELSEHTETGKLLPWPALVRLMVRVAEALHYAHSRGVTHRDIKPANIMFDMPKNMVKLMDFGVARVADAARTRTGVVLGTPSFMSPEQLSGQTIDGRSDVYSLGVTLFQLLTGRLPYTHDSMASLMRAVANDPAPHVCDVRVDLPRQLGDVVELALQKHPNTRYANAQQMADDLRAVLTMAPPDSRKQGIDVAMR